MNRVFDKKVLLIILPFIVLIAIVTVFLFIDGNEKPKSDFPLPTSVPEGEFPKNKRPLLTIISSEVPQRPIGLYEGVSIRFSTPPSTSKFSYEISPQIPVTLSLDGETILIRPRPTWKPNTEYKLRIKKDTVDVYGNLIDKEYEFKFKTLSDPGI